MIKDKKHYKLMFLSGQEEAVTCLIHLLGVMVPTIQSWIKLDKHI